MDWTELVITVPRGSADEAAAAALMFSAGGLYIEDYGDLEQGVWDIAHVDLIDEELRAQPRDVVKIHLYVSADGAPEGVAEAAGRALDAAGIEHSLARGTVRQEDWESAWKRYYHPVEIGARIAVAPSWEPYTGKGRTVLRLDPGMAFGTGTHETTALCLAMLDGAVRGGERVLDVGTGSGILAVAALLLGARSALGVDIDPMAVRVARENAELNGVAGRFSAVAGDLASRAEGRYDIITANIVADAVLRLAPAIPPLLAEGGVFIASGILSERAGEVEAGLAREGLAVESAAHKNGWGALLAVRN